MGWGAGSTAAGTGEDFVAAADGGPSFCAGRLRLDERRGDGDSDLAASSGADRRESGGEDCGGGD